MKATLDALGLEGWGWGWWKWRTEGGRLDTGVAKGSLSKNELDEGGRVAVVSAVLGRTGLTIRLSVWGVGGVAMLSWVGFPAAR